MKSNKHTKETIMYKFGEENEPFLFLRCDDAEYELRREKIPIALNRIQVRNKPYEYRQSHIMSYCVY